MSKQKRNMILFDKIIGDLSGGSDHSLFYIIKGLDRSKYEPIVLYANDCSIIEQCRHLGINVIYINDRRFVNNNKLIINNFSTLKKFQLIKPIKILYKQILTYLYSFILLLKEINIIRNYNIDLIYTNITLSLNREGVVAGIITRKKIISHIRGFPKNLNIFDVYLSEKINRIIVVSNAVKKAYIKKGIKKEKIITIYNGVDIDNFSDIKPKKIDNGYVIGSMGRLVKWKGHINLVYAAKELIKQIPNITFILAGEGPEKLNLQNQVKIIGIENNFFINGFEKDIKKFYSKIDIFIYPSILPDPCPRAVIEAMASGKPVISTKLGGIPEQIGNTDLLLNNAEDTTELTEIMVDLIKSGEIINKGEEGRARVAKKFDIKLTSYKINEVIDQVI